MQNNIEQRRDCFSVQNNDLTNTWKVIPLTHVIYEYDVQ